MKNTYIFGGIFVAALIIGGVMLAQNQQKSQSNRMEEPQTTDSAMMDATKPNQGAPEDKTDSMMKADSQLPANEKAMMADSSRYLAFTPEVLQKSKNTRRVLFFYANWCPTCKPADADFQKNAAQIPSDVTVIRVNYNDTETDQAEKDLAEQYNVTYQHTYVQIDEQGNEVTKWNGGQTAELLERVQGGAQ